MNDNPRIVPSLWFDESTEEAVDFYIVGLQRLAAQAPRVPAHQHQRYEQGMEVPGAEQMQGKVLTAIFELDGQRFMALDGGPIFKFNEAVSFYVECEDQEEVDYFWELLSAVPESEQCGWVKDKFGLSWQIVPRQLGELLDEPRSQAGPGRHERHAEDEEARDRRSARRPSTKPRVTGHDARRFAL